MIDPEGANVISYKFNFNNSLSDYASCTKNGQCSFNVDSGLFNDAIDQVRYYSNLQYVIFDGFHEVPYDFNITVKYIKV